MVIPDASFLDPSSNSQLLLQILQTHQIPLSDGDWKHIRDEIYVNNIYRCVCSIPALNFKLIILCSWKSSLYEQMCSPLVNQ